MAGSPSDTPNGSAGPSSPVPVAATPAEGTAEPNTKDAAADVDSAAESEPEPEAAAAEAPSSSSSSSDRLARFKALQARAKKSASQNLKEAAAESKRLATDTSALAAVSRKHAVASHNLLKADTEAAGEDFERKRAWDWTADEAERWDRRQAKKSRRRGEVAFQDYGAEARKTYKRQMRDLDVDADAYAAHKADAVRRAAAGGGLELVEDEETGELVAIDRDGRFALGAAAAPSGSDFTKNKPSKEGVDRLVNDLKKAEEQRLKARKNRRNADDDDPDITYINEKNKQFNMKLARFYNKYTADIRESFERGTMI